MGSQNHLVSVIIPAYNASAFISDTLNCLLKQSYTNLEILVVDDGSLDNTAEIVKIYMNKDNRIKYYYQKNKGCSFAKNVGLENSTGELIQYLDADDVISEDKIRNQVDIISNKPLAIAVCKTVVFKDISNLNTGHEIDTEYLYSTKNTFEFLTNLYGLAGGGGMIQPNAFLLQKSLSNKIGHWDTSLSPCPDEDGEYFCRAILASDEIVYTEGVNYYRKLEHVSSLSKKNSYEYALGALRSVKLKSKHLLDKNDSNTIKNLVAKHFASIAYIYGSAYPPIVTEVKNEINRLGINKVPIVGGKYFKMLANVLGFENAMKLKLYLK